MKYADTGEAEATDPSRGAYGSGHLRITSESQWRTFANSLASEGLVVELSEQQQLQKLWEREVVGAKSFGRRCVLFSLSLSLSLFLSLPPSTMYVAKVCKPSQSGSDNA